MKELVHLYNEIGMLARVPRSGFAFLGSGQQSVAEHSHRMTLIAYTLAAESKKPVDLAKLLLMCLFHDLPEARTGDLNYVNKRYVKSNEAMVIEEMKKKKAPGPQIAAYLTEFNDNNTLEAHLAHDADQLEMLLVLKELYDIGNPRSMEWFAIVVERLQTKTGKLLAETIKTTPSDEWWIQNKKDRHWVDGKNGE